MTMLLLTKFSRSMLAERGLVAELQEVTPRQARKLVEGVDQTLAIMPDESLAEKAESVLGQRVDFAGPGFIQLEKGQKALVVERRFRDNEEVLEFVSVRIKGAGSFWSRLGFAA